MATRFTWTTLQTAIIAALAVWVLATAASESELEPKSIAIGGGITLHYVEQGAGIPVIFVHGSLSDYSYWQSQLGPFAGHYRAIAYSRRYNFPNHNPARADYSAITDADDLAAFIRALHLEKPFVVGHSYGALTALVLATREPDLVRGLVLAEPPAMSLLESVARMRSRSSTPSCLRNHAEQMHPADFELLAICRVSFSSHLTPPVSISATTASAARVRRVS